MGESIESGINEALRAIHVAQLGDDEDAVRLYDQLCQVAAKRPDGIDDAAQHLVMQIAELERVRMMARKDLEEKGLRKRWTNGRQVMDVENKSVGVLQRSIEQQRKLMNELQITPASRKGAMQLGMFGGDDFDGF